MQNQTLSFELPISFTVYSLNLKSSNFECLNSLLFQSLFFSIVFLVAKMLYFVITRKAVIGALNALN